MHKNEVLVGHVRNFKMHEVENYFESKGWHTVDASYGGWPWYDLVLKKIQYHNANKYLTKISKEPRKLEKIEHNILYFILRYFCFQDKKGGEFIALFENKNMS